MESLSRGMESTKRILLVEDDADQQKKMSDLLTRHHYEVEIARDGAEALTQVRKSAPGLILLDAILPKMNGFQVARLLKFDEKTKGIPIVMLTVLHRPADQEKGKEVGVDLYLAKPLTEQGLIEAVRKFL